MVYSRVATLDQNHDNIAEITTIIEVMEKAMEIEAMVGYPRSLGIVQPIGDSIFSHIQNKISTLTKKVQKLTIPKVGWHMVSF